MRIHHLNCGTFCPHGQLLINGSGSPFASGELVCHCMAIETPQGVVLIDTGLGTNDIADPMESLPGPLWQAINRAQLDVDETMIHQLERLNIKPEDVRHIVLTHLDFDHAGGIADFPHADVHVFRTEHEAATHPRKWIDHERYARRQFAHQPRWQLHDLANGETWMDFEAVRPIPGLDPDVLLIPLPGHSRGHCGVAVKSPSGWLLHAGDAYFHHAELRPGQRECPIGLRVYQNVFQDDRTLRKHNQERLRELAQSAGDRVRILCSHDPDQLAIYQTAETNRVYVS
jgi:glyoxylase-like metal-dependent hydrolase (beta-lactamase superfamily II)